MKDISRKLEIFRNHYYKSCSDYQDGYCRRAQCACRSAAEVHAYTEAILPEGFDRLGIQNFEGVINGDLVIEPQKVEEIKKQIWGYCFGDTWGDVADKYGVKNAELDKLSILTQRHRQGSSVVIHGSHATSENYRAVKSPKGKTMIASIIMKQAIRLKLRDPGRAISFDWVAYPVLQQLFFAAIRDEDAAARLSDYSDADWLVIDDIEPPMGNVSESQLTIAMRSLDAFLMRRLEQRLPTILVFKFDISEFDLRRHFGYSIDTIVNSKNTLTIGV